MTEKELLLTSILDCRRIDLYVDPAPLSGGQKEQLEGMLSRRNQGEPLQYIIGSCEFMGLTFKVDPRVLIPRPETEILVETVLKKAERFPAGRPLKVLDLGTGSGNITISAARFLKSCFVTAVDKSPGALEVAESNALLNGVTNIEFIQSSFSLFFNTVPNTLTEEDKFDIIISNPPYIPTSQLRNLPVDVRQEPKEALDGGEDGLDDIRDIIAKSHNLLKHQGFLIFEIGDGQRQEIEKIFSFSRALKMTGCLKDFNGVERIILGEHRNG